jgi:hypothetical protein
MTETNLEAAVSLRSGFGSGKASGPAATRRPAAWAGPREPSVAKWLMRMGWRCSQAQTETAVQHCGHPGVLADYLSAKSQVE